MEIGRKLDLTIVADKKTSLLIAIKRRTTELFSLGIDFDTKKFPAAKDALFNYNLFKVSPEEFTFPKKIGTLTGETYSLTEANAPGLWTAAKEFCEPIYDGNRDLVDAVAVATTIAQLDAIVDNR